jgi:hypothetical protein
MTRMMAYGTQPRLACVFNESSPSVSGTGSGATSEPFTGVCSVRGLIILGVLMDCLGGEVVPLSCISMDAVDRERWKSLAPCDTSSKSCADSSSPSSTVVERRDCPRAYMNKDGKSSRSRRFKVAQNRRAVQCGHNLRFSPESFGEL